MKNRNEKRIMESKQTNRKDEERDEKKKSRLNNSWNTVKRKIN